MPIESKPCQNDFAESYSHSLPKSLYLFQRLREYGITGTFRQILARLGLGSRKAAETKDVPKPQVTWKESIGLQPGDLVEVRSAEEMLATLDSSGRLKGMALMPQMLGYAGQRFKVYKKMERILIENTGEIRRLKNTVLLEGNMCDGYQGACDKSCFYFWREAWLRKVDANE